jgi:hypothetical protein
MPVFFNDTQDDPLIYDACTSFSGGQVSFQKATLLDPNQAAYIGDYEVSVNGELKKRRGSRLVGTAALSSNRIQNLIWYDVVSASSDKLVAFNAGSASYMGASTWSSLFSGGITDTSEIIDSVQLTDKLYFTGSNFTGIKVWDGTTLAAVTIDGAATPACLTKHGIRLVASAIPTKPDSIYFSSLLDGSSWTVAGVTTKGELKIGNGSGDPIVGHFPWQDSGIIVCTRNATWLIDAPSYDPATGTAMDLSRFAIKLVHSSIGCVSRKTMCQVGQDLWFLSPAGVMSVQKQLATSNNQITIPASQPVQDVINRIRWDYAYKSSAIFHNNCYLLSIPVESTEPNTVLCYNTLTQSWTIITGWAVTCFLKQPYNGGSRLLYGTKDGKVKEWLDYEANDTTDSFYENGADFSATVRTRGMTFNEPISPKSGFYLEFEYILSTASFTINAILDGSIDTTRILAAVTGVNDNVALPADLPFSFPDTTGWVRKKIPLHQLPPFRDIQIEVICTTGSIDIRNITLSGFMDTIELISN